MFKNENTFWNKAKNQLIKLNACNLCISFRNFPN